jgi:hypothetical protein
VFPVRIATSRKNRRIVGSGAFCAVHADAYNEDKLPFQTAELEVQEFGVKRPPPCEDVNPEAQERPPLKDVTQQSSEDRDRGH